MGDDYLQTLGAWRQMLAMGFTTTPEQAEPTRSDTHAWSAHPLYDLLTIVAGIHPGSAGFSSVRITPGPGRLENFAATMPHGDQDIRVAYQRKQQTAQFRIYLPPGLPGTLVWQGKQYALHAGEQTLNLLPAPTR
jgi:hypothetical protein